MILAKEFEGEMWIKAEHHHQAVKQAVEAEREACAKVGREAAESTFYDVGGTVEAAIRARGQE